ncbi:MAG: glycoside hydrolase family 2, partial [Verrucomicrobia bacterium]|nr:glycoside hydrolase family 2 [Verrucomicrobiota bacterium]
MKKRSLFLFLAMPLTAIATPQTLDLAGEWQFQLDPEDIGIEEEWFRSDLSDTIALPATTTTAEKGNETTAELNLKAPTLKRLLQEHQYVGAAWYARTVTLPEDWFRDGSRLVFERVLWESRVWINGHPVGREYSLSTPHRYDLGAFLEPGENRIVVRVDNREL